MLITTGIDIIEVNRIKQAIEEMQKAFFNKIYTDTEIQYCNKAKGEIMYQHFAARFAAKEAAFKAFSGHIKTREDVLWKQIEVVNDEMGRPKINIERLKHSDALDNLVSVDISLSHIKEYAVASVVAMWKE